MLSNQMESITVGTLKMRKSWHTVLNTVYSYGIVPNRKPSKLHGIYLCMVNLKKTYYTLAMYWLPSP